MSIIIVVILLLCLFYGRRRLDLKINYIWGEVICNGFLFKGDRYNLSIYLYFFL